MSLRAATGLMIAAAACWGAATVIAAGLAIALLGERPGWPVLIGGVIVIGAAAALALRVRPET